MALLENLRQRSILLIVVIGIALVGFVLTDAFKNKSQNTDAAVINGKTIDINEYNDVQNDIRNNLSRSGQTVDQEMVNEYAWNDILTSTLMEQQLEKLGVEIGSDELWESLKNNPNLRGQFTSQEGVFDENAFNTWVKERQSAAPNSDEGKQWRSFVEGQQRSLAVNTYNQVIQAGLHTTNLEAKYAYKQQNDKADFQYAYIPYSQYIANIKVTDDELNQYIKDHKKEYEVEENRNLAYIYMPYKPSASDVKLIKGQLEVFKNGGVLPGVNDTISSFASAKNDSLYVLNYSDEPLFTPFIDPSATGPIFSEKLKAASKGEVVGPEEVSDNVYQLLKVEDVKEIPDSLKSSHILIAGNNRTPDEAKKLADSLKSAIDAGSDFAVLAKDYSEDPGSAANGGDLGWVKQGSFVPEFENFVIDNPVGTVGVVRSQFGYHIIKVEGKRNPVKKVKLAGIVKRITPSKQTTDSIYIAANKFFSESKDFDSFQAAAKKEGLAVQQAKGITAMQSNVEEMGAQRDLVKWSFDDGTSIGDQQIVSDTKGIGIAFLTAKHPKGLASLDDVREQVTLLLKQEKAGDEIVSKVTGKTDLTEIANSMKGEVKAAQAIGFNDLSVGTDKEPKLIGTAFGLKAGETSKPMKGNSAVFVVKLNKLDLAPALKDNFEIKTRLNAGLASKAYMTTKVLQDKAEIEDNRSQFY